MLRTYNEPNLQTKEDQTSSEAKISLSAMHGVEVGWRGEGAAQTSGGGVGESSLDS